MKRLIWVFVLVIAMSMFALSSCGDSDSGEGSGEGSGGGSGEGSGGGSGGGDSADGDDVVIIDNGKISAKGTPLELKNKYTGDFITLYGITESEAKILSDEFESLRDAYRISVSDTEEATRLITCHPQIFKDYEITKGKMDDVFLAVTGKKLIGGDDNENG